MVAKKAAIRFDVSHQVGVGHMKRALAIASRLDESILVVCEAGKEYIKQAGFDENRILEVGYDSVDWMRQIPKQWPLIFDISYSSNSYIAESQIGKASETFSNVVVIDSMPPDHFKGDGLRGNLVPELVITPYFMADRHRHPPLARNWVAGPQYCVLDEGYRYIASKTNSIPEQKRILITCGGSDPTGLTRKCIEGLQDFEGSLDVVVGPLFTIQLCNDLKHWAKSNEKIVLHMQPKCLATLIANAALVVGRPGLIRYEAAALGRNTVLYSETESYYEYYKMFSSGGMGKIFFKSDPGGEYAFLQELKQIASLGINGRWLKFNAYAKSIVPADGVDNVLDLIFR